jgi:hypothetical protein
MQSLLNLLREKFIKEQSCKERMAHELRTNGAHLSVSTIYDGAILFGLEGEPGIVPDSQTPEELAMRNSRYVHSNDQGRTTRKIPARTEIFPAKLNYQDLSALAIAANRAGLLNRESIFGLALPDEYIAERGGLTL